MESLPKHSKPTTNAELQQIIKDLVNYLHNLGLNVTQTTKVENNHYNVSISCELATQASCPMTNLVSAIANVSVSTQQSQTTTQLPQPTAQPSQQIQPSPPQTQPSPQQPTAQPSPQTTAPYNHPDNTKERIQNLREPQKSTYEKLRQLRLKLAQEERVDKLYIIMTNAMLLELVDHLPRTLEQIVALRGFGPTKCSKYGQRILTTLHGSSSAPSPSTPAPAAPSTPSVPTSSLPITPSPTPIPSITAHVTPNPISPTTIIPAPNSSPLILQPSQPFASVGKGMSSGERIVREALEALNITYIHQQPLVTAGNPNMGGGGLTFDFYLPTLTAAIEVDGEQHRKPVEKYGGLKGFISTLRCDLLKREWCETHHTSLLRVTYDELEDIKTKLLETINLIRTVPLERLPVIIDTFHEERKRLYAHYTSPNTN